MGQAKQRGSREERIKAAQARDAEFRKQYEEEMRARVEAIKRKERERLEAVTPEEREAVRIDKENVIHRRPRIPDTLLMAAMLAFGGAAAVRGKKGK